MRTAIIIGVTPDGKSEILCGMTKYSEARAQLVTHLKSTKFAEILLCEPGKRYRIPKPAARQPEVVSKSHSKA